MKIKQYTLNNLQANEITRKIGIYLEANKNENNIPKLYLWNAVRLTTRRNSISVNVYMKPKFTT